MGHGPQLARRNYGLFAPLPFRPLDDSPPGSFAHWLVRPLADSPTHRGRFAPLACSPPWPYVVSLRYDDRNSMPTTFFSFFSRFSISITFIQRKTTVQQHYKSIASLFRQIRNPKSIFYYLSIHSMCNRKYTFPPRSNHF